MINPSNWDIEMDNLKKRINDRLNEEANKIIKEEISKILGRIKIITQRNFRDPSQYDWFLSND